MSDIEVADMVTVNTRNLEGKALNWAVAKCLGFGPHKMVDCKTCNGSGKVAWYGCADMGERDCDKCKGEGVVPYYDSYTIPFSTNWGFSGPIIIEEDISFRKYHNPRSEEHGLYYAKVCRDSGSMIGWSKKLDYTGPTALIASLRCFVANKLGKEIEIPKELV